MKHTAGFRRGRLGLGSLVLTSALVLSLAGVTNAATTDPNPTPRETANAALSRSGRHRGHGAAGEPRPCAADARRPATSRCSASAPTPTVKGGTGSGDVNNRSTVTVRQGLENAGYTVTTTPAYWNAMVGRSTPSTPARRQFGRRSTTLVERPREHGQPTAATDTAIYVVARNSGEGRGPFTATKGDY